jgi:hypothetical protein
MQDEGEEGERWTVPEEDFLSSAAEFNGNFAATTSSNAAVSCGR